MNEKRTIGKGCSGRFIKPPCGAAFNGVVLSDRVKAYAASCRTGMRMVWAEELIRQLPESSPEVILNRCSLPRRQAGLFLNQKKNHIMDRH